MRAVNWKIAAACLTAAGMLVFHGSPAFADQDAEVTKDVRVKIVKCHDGDCAEMAEGVSGSEDIEIVAGDDLVKKVVIRKVGCEGEDCSDHDGHHKMVFVGDGGDVRVITGDGGHSWVSSMSGPGGGYLGVGLTELTPELREHFGVVGDAGVMVAKVVEESPAFRAGVEVGDIITSVDGEPVASGSSLAGAIRSRDAGEEVLLGVWRDGAAQTITAAVEARKVDKPAWRLGDGHHGMHKIMVHCDSDDEDCRSNVEIAGLDDFDCGSDECEVEVECQDGTCKCSVNGALADCAKIPGVPGH